MPSTDPSPPSSDFVIVGGGILGLAHAVAALRAGASVTLLERHGAARGASVRNFGMVWPIGQPDGARLAEALRSRELWTAMAAAAGISCRQSGSLHLAHAEDEWQVLEEFVARSELTGLELWTPDRVRAAVPHVVQRRLVGALFSPHEMNLDAPAAIAGLTRWLARQPRASVLPGTPAVAVDDRTVLCADGSRHAAGHVVICSGDEFRLLFPAAFAASDLVRCRLQMTSLGPQPASFRLGPMLAAGLTLLHYHAFRDCPSLPALRARLERTHGPLIAQGIHVLVSQGDDGRLVVGDSHASGQDFAPWSESAIEALILGELLRFLDPPNREVERRWTGCYAMRRGGEPIFRAEPLPGVEIVTGVGGSGMTRSMAIGEATITRRLAGRS
jgi:FAD dependent oxidoreductase TIGR03364